MVSSSATCRHKQHCYFSACLTVELKLVRLLMPTSDGSLYFHILTKCEAVSGRGLGGTFTRSRTYHWIQIYRAYPASRRIVVLGVPERQVYQPLGRTRVPVHPKLGTFPGPGYTRTSFCSMFAVSGELFNDLRGPRPEFRVFETTIIGRTGDSATPRTQIYWRPQCPPSHECLGTATYPGCGYTSVPDAFGIQVSPRHGQCGGVNGR